MKFFQDAGKMAIGSRVRHLADRITADAALVYEAYGNELQPKWFPVFYVLTKGGGPTVTSIAEEIGHSHVSVSKILKEMTVAGVVTQRSDASDGRRTIVSLAKHGREIAQRMEAQYVDVRAAMDELSADAEHDLWAALEEWDRLLSTKSLLDRVLAQRRERESARVRIEDYRPKHRQAFRELNEDWIRTHFELERPDVEALADPKKKILARGGQILVATLDGKPVGVCALIPMGDGVFELAKMAVARELRGKHVGWKLGQAVIARAKGLGARKLYVESNTVLEPAIRLYRKLGFEEVTGRPTPYERCNIQMELALK